MEISILFLKWSHRVDGLAPVSVGVRRSIYKGMVPLRTGTFFFQVGRSVLDKTTGGGHITRKVHLTV